MKEKKESTLSKLMHFAGNHKYYVYASCILAAISAFIALVPFYDMWLYHQRGIRSKTKL